MPLIQTAKNSDISLIVNFVNNAYRGEKSKKGWTTEAFLLGGNRVDEQIVLEMIHKKNAQIDLLFENSELLGCVYLKQESNDTLYFGMLTVLPEKQSQGIGKFLLNHIEALARLRHLQKIRLTVIHLRVELIEYYQRRGYVLTGKTEEFPQDPRYGIPQMPLVLLEMIKNNP
jgi:GNAT superfamily N-acetyltransferase